MSVKTQFLRHCREALDMEDCDPQAYRDTQSIDQTFIVLYYSSTAQSFATS